MRIIGGTAAGTILTVPKRYDVRPTPDLVRQAIFNSLGERVIDAVEVEFWQSVSTLLGLSFHWRALRRKLQQAQAS